MIHAFRRCKLEADFVPVLSPEIPILHPEFKKMWIRAVCLSAIIIACATISGISQNRSYFVAFGAGSSIAVSNTDELRIYDLVNRQRSQNGLNFLSWDESLAAIARNYSERMAAGEFFGHVDPTGATVRERIDLAGVHNWLSVGENLFNSRNIPDYVPLAVKMWMNSSSHRQNVLDTRWSSAGVGIAKGPDGRVYVTQLYLQK